MTLAACLALYGLLVAVGGPAALRQHQAGHAPRLAVLIWVTTLAGAVAALAGAIVVVVATLLLETGGLSELLHGCLAVLDALGAGGGTSVLAGLVAAAGGVWLLRAAWRAARTLTTARRTHARLATRLRTVGRFAPALGRDTLVVPSPEPVVYCLAGRRPTVVVTSGALDALAEDELAAVLTHERAHLAGRHHLVLVFARAVRRVMLRCRCSRSPRRRSRGCWRCAPTMQRPAATAPDRCWPRSSRSPTGHGRRPRLARAGRRCWTGRTGWSNRRPRPTGPPHGAR